MPHGHWSISHGINDRVIEPPRDQCPLWALIPRGFHSRTIYPRGFHPWGINQRGFPPGINRSGINAPGMNTPGINAPGMSSPRTKSHLPTMWPVWLSCVTWLCVGACVSRQCVDQRYLVKHSIVVEQRQLVRRLRHVFLFSDIFVCSKQKIANKWVYPTSIYSSSLIFRQITFIFLLWLFFYFSILK